MVKMMRKTLSLLLTLILLLGAGSAAAAKTNPTVATSDSAVVINPKAYQYPNMHVPLGSNMPVGSIYYDYLDKLDGLGYLKTMLYGARPYSRMDMARWTEEAIAISQRKPTPAYVQKMIEALKKELAPELSNWSSGGKAAGIKVHQVALEAAYGDFEKDSYASGGISTASWQPFSTNNNGHHYGNGTNFNLSTYISGNLNKDLVISVSPRIGYDWDNHFNGAFDEAYLSTRIGMIRIEAGKQALDWGQGVSGKMALGNNMRPMTMLKITTEERPVARGILKIFGKSRWSGFISQLENDRSEKGLPDHDKPTLLGVRSDFMYPNLNIGFEKVSMLSGEGNAFQFSDTWDWLTSKEGSKVDYKWNDIAGVDVKYRFPGLQVYGEIYGEDRNSFLLSDIGYRLGFYAPRLTKDGTWDLRLEGAHTSDEWYVHRTYADGWTYHNDIMGDAMGSDATKLYGGITHYLPNGDSLAINGQYQKLGEMGNLTPKVLQGWVSWRHKLNSADSLTTMVGLASLKDLDYEDGRDHTDKFVKILWTRSY
jgi:hypothetical protein